MENNGHASTPFSNVEHEIRALTGSEALLPPAPTIGPPMPQPRIAPPETMPMHEREMHDLMHKTVDQVCAEWVRQLEQVRRNSEHIEQLVLEEAAKVKADISQLYVMGQIAAEEARRGDEVNQKLMQELTALQEKHHDD